MLFQALVKKIKSIKKIPKISWWALAPVLLVTLVLILPLDIPKSRQIEIEGSVEIGTLPYYSEVTGKIVELPVNLGQRVQAGEVLAKIDDAEVQLKVSGLKTNIEKTQLLIEELENGAGASEKKVALQNVEVARQIMFNAHADYLLAINNFEKEKDKVDEVTRDTMRIDMDNKGRLFRIAELQFFNSQETPKQLSAASKSEQIASARADLEFLREQLAAAEKDLAKKTILATADGIVVTKNFEPGGIVNVGQIILEVSKESEKMAVFWVPEEYLGQIEYGQLLPVTVKSQTGREQKISYQAQVNFIDLSAQYTPKEAASSVNQNKLSFQIKTLLPEDASVRVAQRMLLTLSY